MDHEAINSRLSRISTVWTLLSDARGQAEPAGRDARLALIQRYQGAAYRYLLGALRDPDAADEVFQEFALRVMQGAFSGADYQRGRFRDYLKTTLFHLIVDYQNRQRKRLCTLDSDVAHAESRPWAPDDAERQFVESWREELMARAWAAMQRAEKQGGPPHYSALRFRAAHPEASSADMAAGLTEQLRPKHPFTETGIRKTLQRARAEFAELLVDEVAASLSAASPDELEQELIDLALLPYCRSALARRQRLR